MWVKLPAAQPTPNDFNEVVLLEFGNPDVMLPYPIGGVPSTGWAVGATCTKSGIFMNVNPSGGRYISAQFSAASYPTTVSDLGSAAGSISGTWWRNYNDTRDYAQPALNQWLHVFVAYDGTNASTVPAELLGTHPNYTCGYATSHQTLYIFLNGSNVSGSYLSATSDNDGRYVPVGAVNAPGQVLATLTSHSSQNTNSGNAPLTNVPTPVPQSSPDTDPSTSLLYFDHPGNVLTLASLPIAVSGTSIGLPTMTANRSQSPQVECADVQIWFGQFIDPTNPANLAKFISGGIPVSSSVAATAFGTPDYLFKGNAAAFIANGGSGGSVTKAGTVTDATPGPG
jgi:hypothetical protein